jgi:hypothetical protein
MACRGTALLFIRNTNVYYVVLFSKFILHGIPAAAVPQHTYGGAGEGEEV